MLMLNKILNSKVKLIIIKQITQINLNQNNLQIMFNKILKDFQLCKIIIIKHWIQIKIFKLCNLQLIYNKILNSKIIIIKHRTQINFNLMFNNNQNFKLKMFSNLVTLQQFHNKIVYKSNNQKKFLNFLKTHKYQINKDFKM